MSVPFLDLRGTWEELRTPLLRACAKVLSQGRYILGDEVAALEREVAAYCGMNHGVAVGNGTDALTLSLRALGVGPGDEVVTSPFTFFATVESILQVGATPVFADVDPRGFTITPATVEPRITARTKAILPVHIFGLMADMAGLRALADAYRLVVVEDACQAIGATWRGFGIGHYGDAAALSFFPTKNLGGYGDGGMILVHDAELAARLRRLRAHGSAIKYIHEEPGWNSRLDELQAALLRVKLAHLPAWTSARQALAARYDAGLAGLGLQLPWVPAEANHVYHLYTVLVPDRTALQRFLAERGIEAHVYYPLPMHLQPALSGLGYRPGDFPVAERICQHALSLPLYPGLTAAQQDEVMRGVRAFLHRRGAPSARAEKEGR
ncbi:hypothetical protein GCM10010885_14540 [Alicyclobacillus cellulosilyticus]|uniref:dTDP-4-amino-4,6-dideoxygalactose transaminase n=1 Tax=Alicyclobacillus cellulosilyticus TaxID=1003997 RepID=A0A917KC46_9BACL|nr:DegT/DnrJ/EryC1/StrS family aminotransferase [Alicyclobacillus cellulosilyticus]GGJ06490.1 hypothetical protein GCM10010885_14540 [Alicyclobacillus cellulosilyticus]